MPVNLACSIGWLTREPQLTLHFNGCASSTATLPEMQNPSPANDRQCRSLEFLNDFFVPSLSSRYFHSSSRSSTGPRYICIYVYAHIIYIYIHTYTHTMFSCRFTANRARCVCTQLRVQRRLSLVRTRLSTRGSQAFERVGGTVGLPHIRLGVSDAFEITFVPR